MHTPDTAFHSWGWPPNKIKSKNIKTYELLNNYFNNQFTNWQCDSKLDEELYFSMLRLKKIANKKKKLHI